MPNRGLSSRVRNAAVAAILLMVPASAWGAFTNPATLSAAHHNASFAQVAIDPSGNVLTVWKYSNGSYTSIQARARSTAGRFGAVLTVSLPGKDVYAPVVAEDGKGNALIVWSQSNGTNFRVSARTLSAAGKLGAIRFLSAAGADAFYPTVAMTTGGRAIVAWTRAGQIEGCARTPAGVFSAVQSLSPVGQAVFPEAAIRANGDAVVVWSRLVGSRNRIELRARRVAGTLTALQTVSNINYDSSGAELSLDRLGNALVVWSSTIGGKQRVEARSRSAAGTLGVVQNISAAGVVGEVPQVAERSDGNAVIVWETRIGQGVLARSRSPSGALGTIQTISDGAVGAYPKLAMQTNGNVLIAWEGAADFFVARRIKVRTRSASGALGAINTISADFSDAYQPEVVVKPTGGGAVVWQRSDGNNDRIQLSVGP